MYRAQSQRYIYIREKKLKMIDLRIELKTLSVDLLRIRDNQLLQGG